MPSPQRLQIRLRPIDGEFAPHEEMVRHLTGAPLGEPGFGLRALGPGPEASSECLPLLHLPLQIASAVASAERLAEIRAFRAGIAHRSRVGERSLWAAGSWM